MKKTLLTFLAATLFCGSVWASGYQVLLQSNRSTAMGNIGVGLRPDPSSINFNPGALAMMRENGVQVGANLIYSGIAFQPFESGEVYRTENPVGTPFHVFATFGGEESKLKFGLGVYTPYGSTVIWEDDWAGRFNLTQLSLQAIFIQPTVSYRITEQLSLGVGFIYSFGGVNLQRDIQAVYLGGNDYGSAELDGSASGFGYNLGLYFEPSEEFSLGINYRSRVNMKVENGTATFVKSPLVPDSQIPSETGFTSELPLPSNLTIGFSYRPTERFMVGADITRTGWNAYEALVFNYEDPVGGETTTVAARNYETSYAYRLGGEYAVSELFKLRAGAYYDQSPVQEGFLTPESPDANTLGLTAGFGLNIGEDFVVDASFLYINKEQRDNIANPEAGDLPLGTYKSVAVIPGLTLTYKF
ncbi:OmpP1/FadL family transporter [Nafulsella turpanensis]|uniref:OmpP1/FadL family transporter n=1 Tax=Nafulsella turpanensis TaxID=1265690 RepID=UPI00034758EB|nr:outer membrane protein transport protein [Nafulsella turpanensis]